jgi:hypothetical protein
VTVVTSLNLIYALHFKDSKGKEKDKPAKQNLAEQQDCCIYFKTTRKKKEKN